MGNKLTDAQLTLYRAVDEVLHYVWDPIGISSIPQARDEYQSYLPLVFELLNGGQEAEEIAAYLSNITSARMGLSTNIEHDLSVAQLLVAWRQRCGALETVSRPT